MESGWRNGDLSCLKHSLLRCVVHLQLPLVATSFCQHRKNNQSFFVNSCYHGLRTEKSYVMTLKARFFTQQMDNQVRDEKNCLVADNSG